MTKLARSVLVHKHTEKDLGRYPAVLTEQASSITHKYKTQVLYFMHYELGQFGSKSIENVRECC